MKILAFDQSSRVTGWSFFQDDKLIQFGHWSEKAEDIGIRIKNIFVQVQNKINDFQPDLIVFENIQLQAEKENFSMGIDTFQKLSWIQGVLILICQNNNIPYKIVYASEWRKTCNFLKNNDKHRDNQKKITQDWVLNTYGVKCIQDEADAICIGFHMVNQLNLNYYDWSD